MNAYRRFIAAAIVVSLCPYGALVTTARAAPRLDFGRPTTRFQVVSPTTADEARLAIERLGVGRRVAVVLTGGMLRGQIAEIRADHFVLLRDTGGGPVTIGYADVQEVGSHMGTTKKVLIVAGLAALAAMVAIAVNQYRTLRK